MDTAENAGVGNTWCVIFRRDKYYGSKENNRGSEDNNESYKG